MCERKSKYIKTDINVLKSKRGCINRLQKRERGREEKVGVDVWVKHVVGGHQTSVYAIINF